ncbi:MAG: tetratricopeptide repeat protein, partial [Planctomycetes bacterium]|nr:tetratricopeptide repeat protein [Planctomycetota bacterium]
HKARGELDEAERMHRKALEINEKLGRLEGMAIQYANLGGVQEQRGDLAGARKLGTKARDLYARIGMPRMVAQMQSALDGLPPSEGGEAAADGGR